MIDVHAPGVGQDESPIKHLIIRSKEGPMRNLPYKLAMVASLVTLVTGCVGTKTFKEFNINEGTSISIDATQRVVLVKGDKVCAEPSPDAMVVAAANAALKGDVAGYGGVEVSGGFSQTASTIGIRTVTIQLLRDGYFRACEASMNEMVDTAGYERILKGIGPVMAGLVAIDALTQMKPAPTVVIANVGDAKTTADGTASELKVEIKIDQSEIPKQVDVEKIADHVVKIIDSVLVGLGKITPEEWLVRLEKMTPDQAKNLYIEKTNMKKVEVEKMKLEMEKMKSKDDSEQKGVKQTK